MRRGTEVGLLTSGLFKLKGPENRAGSKGYIPTFAGFSRCCAEDGALRGLDNRPSRGLRSGWMIGDLMNAEVVGQATPNAVRCPVPRPTPAAAQASVEGIGIWVIGFPGTEQAAVQALLAAAQAAVDAANAQGNHNAHHEPKSNRAPG